MIQVMRFESPFKKNCSWGGKVHTSSVTPSTRIPDRWNGVLTLSENISDVVVLPSVNRIVGMSNEHTNSARGYRVCNWCN